MDIPDISQSVGAMVDMQHNIAKGHVPAQPKIGVVLAPPPNIQVKLDDIILTKENVYISHYLLAGYERTAKGNISSGTQPASCPVGAPHTHPIDNPYIDNIIYTDTLKTGDLVSVLTCAGDQLYIITDKVVKL